MQNPNAIVSTTIRLDPPLDRPAAELLRAERGISVELDAGRRVRLDPANPRSAGYAQVLDGLSRQRLPVYLEVDPATSAITRLLVPDVTRVVRIHPMGEGVLGVELERSHGRHVLRPGAPDFAELERGLREALRTGRGIIVTENDAHEIMDVREYTPGPEGPLPPFPRPELLPRWWRRIQDLLRRLWWWRWWPWWWFRCVSAAKAQQVFDAMHATTCDPLTVPPPCIPFLYPDDGCWGRAHEMCRLMINLGLTPRKVWIEGSGFLSLVVSTSNNPQCSVAWNWHVAPTLCVRGPKLWQKQEMVIDPSLFTTPVSKSTWKGAQSDVNATLTDSDASIFYLWGSVTDPSYVSTNQVLATHRLKLQTRALQEGPPPYACP